MGSIKRVRKLFLLIAFIMVVLIMPALFRQNLANLVYLPSLPRNSIAFAQPLGSETCHQLWLRTAASSRNPTYTISSEDLTTLLACSESYVSFLGGIQPANYNAAALTVKMYPGNSLAWYWLGISSLNSSPHISLDAFFHVIQLDPANGQAWCRIGVADEQTNQASQAAAAYLQCCQNGDPGVNGCYGAGRMEEKLGNPLLAIKYYNLSSYDKALKRAAELASQLNPLK